jgi:hypothetical protein
MASRIRSGCVAASLILAAALAMSVEAQPYGGPGAGVPGQTWTPFYAGYYGAPPSYPYGDYGDYGYSYLPSPGYFFPYASRYLPSYSYTPNPYMQMPGAAAYGTLPFTYSPNAYTYDLYSQSYGYYPPTFYYPPPVFPYGYYYYHFIPRRPRSPYRPMTLPEYIYRQSQGPTRVRDIVPGVPELGG